MGIPPHTVNIYQRPGQGNLPLDRYWAFNYKHRIAAVGGFDNASFDIVLRDQGEGLKFLYENIGNRVAVYVDNPAEPVWEGYINRLTWQTGVLEWTISLDEMANRVDCIYTDTGVSATLPQVTPTVNDVLSQAVYGIKQDSIDLGDRAAGLGAATYRDSQLNQRAWPAASSRRVSGAAGTVRVECLGFFHTLEWETYRNTSTTSTSLSAFITGLILPALANGTTFFDNTDVRDIVTNATTITRRRIRAETVWDTFKDIREQGDGTNYWVIGITPTELGTGKRRLYYRPANFAIQYTALQRDGLRVRNIFRQPIPPWTVRPDCGIRLADYYIGENSAGDNPTETYVMYVDYDANTQTVSWQGDDDRTAEGIFGFRRSRKAPGRRFAPIRLL